jgi:ABC-type uncharacterized transport system auxiliary subunit
MITPSKRRFAVATAFLCLYGTMPLLFTGCLTRPALVHQSFALASPASTGAAAKPGKGILALRSCTVSPLFEDRALVYRIGPEAYEHDPYAGFLVPPGSALEIPVRGYLRNSGVFRDIAESGSLLTADRWLEVYISELYGDFQSPGQPAAVLTIRFVFFRSESGNPSAVWLDQTCSRRIPLTENTAASVVAGWDKALVEIMAEVASQLTVPKP